MSTEVAEELRAAHTHLAGPASCTPSQRRAALLAVARARVRLRRHAAAAAAQQQEATQLDADLSDRLTAAQYHLSQSVRLDQQQQAPVSRHAAETDGHQESKEALAAAAVAAVADDERAILDLDRRLTASNEAAAAAVVDLHAAERDAAAAEARQTTCDTTTGADSEAEDAHSRMQKMQGLNLGLQACNLSLQATVLSSQASSLNLQATGLHLQALTLQQQPLQRLGRGPAAVWVGPAVPKMVVKRKHTQHAGSCRQRTQLSSSCVCRTGCPTYRCFFFLRCQKSWLSLWHFNTKRPSQVAYLDPVCNFLIG